MNFVPWTYAPTQWQAHTSSIKCENHCRMQDAPSHKKNPPFNSTRVDNLE